MAVELNVISSKEYGILLVIQTKMGRKTVWEEIKKIKTYICNETMSSAITTLIYQIF